MTFVSFIILLIEYQLIALFTSIFNQKYFNHLIVISIDFQLKI